jgi:acyl-homoserine lactone acylase PvdQ
MRVRHGAGLRLIAEMRKKPVVKMVNDSGNSGHYGHKHLDDQNPLWSRGEPFVLAVDKADLKDDALEGGVDLMPAE